MNSTQQKRALAASEVAAIRESYGYIIDEFEGILDPPQPGDEDYERAQDMQMELDACEQLQDFVDIHWCSWLGHLHVLDVDGYLGNRDFDLDDETDARIVRFVFCEAYGVEV